MRLLVTWKLPNIELSGNSRRMIIALEISGFSIGSSIKLISKRYGLSRACIIFLKSYSGSKPGFILRAI
jgi:hypothetical protein